ncbi:MAG TPA: hypothetical protein VJN90_10925 [Candidatus Acidoferrales bacterium]|nr:hypothetical protein [Candidatus Acidoferrales bacterium]
MTHRSSLLMSATITCALFLLVLPKSGAQQESPTSFSFAVAGDSRNCGDVVMPAIAAGAIANHASFYWHLGDLRRIYDFDEDMQHEPENVAKPMTIIQYEQTAWPDFIANQISAFGSLPFFLGIGNHETIPPMTRDLFIQQFADWLDEPALREQRLRDNPADHKLHTYYHWVEHGVDFINLDNSTADQFDHAQMAWFEGVIGRDEADPKILTIVAGMHEALPESVSSGHSMNESAQGIESGRRVYADLLAAQNRAHKHVYVLASHSHFYMADIFNTDYWRNHGGVLPGWIIGTAGAQRYALPSNYNDAQDAQTNVYGYLMGTVQPSGEIHFVFHKLEKSDIPAPVASRFTSQFVDWCFAKNSLATSPGSVGH